jgi:hypothetical protein
MDEDLDKTGEPRDGEDAHDEDQAPFGRSDDALDVENVESVDPGEEAVRIGEELASLDVEGDETPAPEMPVAEPSPPDPGESSLPEIPEFSRPDTANVDLAEELPGATESEFTPDFEDLDKTQSEMERFGNDVERFDAAGGADNSVPNIGDDSSGDENHDAGQELMDADMGNRNRMSEMLIEHARLIDEINRGLESERL